MVRAAYRTPLFSGRVPPRIDTNRAALRLLEEWRSSYRGLRTLELGAGAGRGDPGSLRRWARSSRYARMAGCRGNERWKLKCFTKNMELFSFDHPSKPKPQTEASNRSPFATRPPRGACGIALAYDGATSTVPRFDRVVWRGNSAKFPHEHRGVQGAAVSVFKDVRDGFKDRLLPRSED